MRREFQHLIPAVMAIGVVDVFKIIEVRHNQAKRRLSRFGLMVRGLQMIVHAAAV
jgi:hypothetical protein